MDILGFALRLPECGHGGDFFFGYKGRMNTLHAAGSGWQIQHVAASQQALGAVGVDDGSRVHLGRQAEAHTRGHVRLDEAGDDIDRRPLRGEHKVDADSAGHLRQPRDRLFHVGAVEHHQVGKLVDDDDDVGQRLLVTSSKR